ncbi:UbiA prenyltransferase family protein [Dictyostelium discoideum AX4]|uniref:UbiA prenyltransferase domain-containing protein 1 n=1 Tax=Dictyostelium discoideum TaxID=44689 RepID=UBIA1_DICDI|nr:UbiA prenyltransferase family protein [Dictyostelium discoideum AX4]Q54K99.1 RecName: Full=UbiA prenyltransferase domain-containing protein 1 [Dictyostelium discoideum]EAL63654.1 UbiA prenyltransferase family protein [Dictyostelium discoideum AX4]|eukprot:XP_637156.1 UbiA prenyltransferase family protein [Dictyostelium discoideum AX4]
MSTTINRNEKTKQVVNKTKEIKTESSQQQQQKPPISKLMGIILATRPWSLTISVTSVLVGSALAFREIREFDSIMLSIILVGAVSLQALGNVVNSFYDCKNGNDTKEKSADRTMFDFGLTEGNIINLIWYLLIQCAICLGLMIFRMDNIKCIVENILPLGAFGFILNISYTAAPIGLKYIGLGDLTIFLCFGPILVQSAFISQTHYHDSLAYFYSIPLALTIVAVLHVNNTRDIKADTEAGSITLASKLGFKNCYYIYAGLYLFAYIYLFKLSLDIDKYILNLPLILIPKIISLINQFKNKKLEDLTEKTGQLSFFFGGLNAIGVLLSMQ